MTLKVSFSPLWGTEAADTLTLEGAERFQLETLNNILTHSVKYYTKSSGKQRPGNVRGQREKVLYLHHRSLLKSKDVAKVVNG